MLELIVLGQVPGTSIQITFFQLASMLLAIILTYMATRAIHDGFVFRTRQIINKIAI